MRKPYSSFSSLVRCVFLLVVVFSGVRIASAQSDLGRISGFVKDPSGASITGAKITARNQSGVERQTTSNESGYYVITSVPPGFYTVTVEAIGFQRYQSLDNKLDPTGDLVVDASLTVGAATQTIEVSASTVQLQTESATVQKLITREQIDALELNGRNPILMANLVPGTRGGNLAGLSFNFSQGPSNINGARTPESLITFDGAPAVRTRSNGTSIGAADVDSTQEIQILTTDYSPEFGRSSGGQIRVVSKTGTQKFHGAAYEYDRNTIFNANPWLRNANARTTHITAPIHCNQFGYNVNGPFYIPDHFNAEKSKVFWYWGQEWVRYVFTDTNTMLVPTLAMRTGDFSELLSPTNIFYGKAVQLTDPKTGLPFPNNVIPAPGTVTTGSTASANGLGILNAYPAPNLTTPVAGNNWFESAKHPQKQRKDTIAVDVNLTEKQRLRFRRVYFTFFEYQPLDGGSGETPKFFDRPNQTNSINHIWAISPTKVNEALVSFSLDQVHIPVDAPNFLDRTQGAAQGPGLFGTNFPYIFPASEKLLPNRIPTVNLGNFAGLSGGPYPSHSQGPIYDVSDSFTWIRGNHTIKFGASFERSGENDNDEINVAACNTCTNNQNGQFFFSNNGGNFVRPGYVAASTGAAAANAALGLFDTYSEIGHRAYTLFRSHMYEGFAQDSWKTSPRLTLTFGLRYTVIVPYHAIWGNMIVFDPNFYDPNNAVTVDPGTGLITGTPTIAQLYNGMVIPGSSFPSSANGRVPEATSGLYNGLFRGVPNHYSDIQWGNFQPRVGIAYQIDKRSVIRAGGGRFITRLGVSDSIFLGGNPPFQPNATVSFGSVDNPGGNGAAQIPLLVTTQSKNFHNPEAWGWNVSFERELFWKSIVSVGYVARRGIHLQREADINQPTTDVVAANPGVNINALRPYKGFGSIRQTNNVANSMYNSLQVTWNRRFANGLQFGASYTLSKSMDSGSNQRDVVPDTYNTSMLWGPSEFDARHIVVLNYLYELPLFRHQSGIVGKALGGWQISGITQFQTGLPCSVAAATDFATVGPDANYGCGVNGQFWVLNGDPKIIGTFGSNGQWFQTCKVVVVSGACPDGTPKFNGDDERIFRPPTLGTFAAQRVRNLIYQPGFSNWNMGLFKSFPLNESIGFQFRAEAYNVWNHPNWCGNAGCSGTTNIGLNPTNLSTFGKVLAKGSGSSGGSERNLQLSLRFYF